MGATNPDGTIALNTPGQDWELKVSPDGRYYEYNTVGSQSAEPEGLLRIEGQSVTAVGFDQTDEFIDDHEGELGDWAKQRPETPSKEWYWKAFEKLRDVKIKVASDEKELLEAIQRLLS